MKLYLKNSVFGIFQLLFPIALIFVSIPVFIHTYGISAYGVFSVLSLLGNLTLLFNFGLNAALLKFISGKDAVRSRNRHVTVSLLILTCITIVFTTILVFLQNTIVNDVLNTSPGFKKDILLNYKIFLLANFFIMLGQPFMVLIQAQRVVFIAGIVQLIYTVLNWGGIIVLCQLNVPFKFIALPALLSAIAWFCLLLFFAVKKYGFRLAVFTSWMQFIVYVKKQLSYSSRFYFSSLLSVSNEPLLKIFVMKYLGPQAAGSFDIVLTIKAQLMALFIKVFEPLSFMLASRRNKEDLRNLVHYSEQLAVFAFIPLCLTVHFFAEPVLHLWITNISDQLVLNIKVAVIIFMCSIIVLPNYYYLSFHNHIKDCKKIQIAGIGSSLLFFFAFRKIFDVNTPVMSVCIGMIIAFLVNIYYQWKHLHFVIFDSATIYSLLAIAALTGLYIAFSWLQLYIPVLVVIVLAISVSAKYIAGSPRRGIHKIFQFKKLAA